MEGKAIRNASPVNSPKRLHKHIRAFPVWVVFLCMLPGILHYTIFRLFPSTMTAVLSFTDISGIPGSAWQWIGWDNYREFFILQNIRDLKASLGRTAIYALSVTLIQNALALLTISDNPFTGEGLDSEQRQNTFTQMMEIALEIA
mgnify:CR=1 FL=1